MNRSFDTHIIRDERSLDGVWDFRMDEVEKAYNEVKQLFKKGE